MRAAIYARFSSDLQDIRSIAGQLAMARERAARQGWLVVAEFTDAAISGASMANRPGLQDLMRTAQAVSSMRCSRRAWTGSAATSPTAPRSTGSSPIGVYGS